jgi:antitoxin (DNA-binding transcriptional repressor) of toxin-antitoxin stability system
MKTMTVGEFKTRFSEVVDLILKGEEVEITYGRKRNVIATLIPKKKEILKEREFGKWENMPGFYMADDFNETTYEDFPIDELL